MAAIKLLFTDRHTPAAVVVRGFTWSTWSHVDAIDDQHVIGAWRSVERIPMNLRLAAASRAAIMTIPCDEWQRIAFIGHLLSQEGKPYDWPGIYGIGFRRRWQDDDSWFCSELQAWALQQVGLPMVDAEHIYRVTPQDLWQCPYQKETVK